METGKVYVYVYRNSLGDCTNNGLTSKVDGVMLHYGTDVNIDEIPDNELVLIQRTLWGKQANYAVPVGVYKSGHHQMAGGNFVYTSDSRFPESAPISVHDRVEY